MSIIEEQTQHCPKCCAELVHIQRKGMILEVCSKCRGMWFDAGELTMLIQAYRPLNECDTKPTTYNCVRCQGKLAEIHFPGTEVVIDRCVDCQGVWLDNGELALLKRAFRDAIPSGHADLNARADILLSDIERNSEQRFCCPKCQKRLWHLKRSGMIVEMCSGCRGMWFDAGELTILLEVYRDFQNLSKTKTEFDCLRCGDSLESLKYPGTNVEIDRCQSCQGTWLDNGEFEELKTHFNKIAGSSNKTYSERATEILSTVTAAVDQRESCPRCENKLTESKIEGLRVENCEKCQGIWFDAGELTIILGVSRRIKVRTGKETELHCVKCPSQKLVELPYPKTEVLIDNCPDCRGVWLDGGELQTLKATV